MPRNVRNAWVDLRVDGRSDIGTGPVSKDGELVAEFLVRDRGRVVRSVKVYTQVLCDGTLKLVVLGPDGKELYIHETVR